MGTSSVWEWVWRKKSRVPKPYYAWGVGVQDRAGGPPRHRGVSLREAVGRGAGRRPGTGCWVRCSAGSRCTPHIGTHGCGCEPDKISRWQSVIVWGPLGGLEQQLGSLWDTALLRARRFGGGCTVSGLAPSACCPPDRPVEVWMIRAEFSYPLTGVAASFPALSVFQPSWWVQAHTPRPGVLQRPGKGCPLSPAWQSRQLSVCDSLVGDKVKQPRSARR